MLKITLKYFFSLSVSCILCACSPGTKIASVETSVIQFNSSDTPEEDSAAIREIDPYKKGVEREMSGILIYSEQEIIKGDPESLLGNLIADITLKKARDYYMLNDSHPDTERQGGADEPDEYSGKYSGKIDFCLLNNGGLRASLPKGDITTGNIYELMPFGNTLVVITLSGENTKKLLNFVARSGGEPVSGVRMGIKDSAPVNILINEKPFDVKKNYRVATSDYLANRGGAWDFFSEPLHVDFLKYMLRDAIIEFMIEESRQGNMLKVQLDGRIYNVE